LVRDLRPSCVAILDRHAVLLEIVALGHLGDPTRVLFALAPSRHEEFGPVENLEVPPRARRRIVAKLTDMRTTIGQSDAPEFLAWLPLSRRCHRPIRMRLKPVVIFFRAELIDRGRWGYEAQIVEAPDDLRIGHRFDHGEDAVLWAESMRADMLTWKFEP